MAKSLNRFTFIGNLGRDPEAKYLPSGKMICSFSVALGRNVKNAAGGWDEETEWINVVAWEKTAEIANEQLRKGSKLYGEGRLQTRSWEKDGQKQYKTEIVLDVLILLDSRAAAPAQAAVQPVDLNMDDLPF